MAPLKKAPFHRKNGTEKGPLKKRKGPHGFPEENESVAQGRGLKSNVKAICLRGRTACY